MKIEIIRETLKNKSLKKEFALITNLISGDSEIFIPGRNLTGMFSKYFDEIEKKFHNNHKLSILANLFDINSTLEKNYIPSVERASMRESLEVRSPFLSRDLFEFVASIDQRKFFKHGQKFLFKKIIKKYLPSELVNSKKRGFIFPINRYLKTVKNFEVNHYYNFF